MGIAEERLLGGNEEVARERQLEATRHARAVDRTDDGLRRLPEGGERADRGVVGPAHQVLRAVGQLPEIEARAERGIGTREHDHINIGVGFRGQQRCAELVL